jgi:hypothetical protein
VLDSVMRRRTIHSSARLTQIDNAFWCACHGGQRATAEYLLERGANRD